MSNWIGSGMVAGSVDGYGYHTFNELYEHRHVLWLNLVKQYADIAFKTRKNDQGESCEGWFILGINAGIGQITYHLPEQYWNYADVPEIDRNSKYDGHTSREVIDRLTILLLGGKNMKVILKRDKIASIAEAWKKQYCNAPEWRSDNSRRIWEKLKELRNPTEKEIVEIIGNYSWTECLCNQCGKDNEALIAVGEKEDYDSMTAYLCETCLRNALKTLSTI